MDENMNKRPRPRRNLDEIGKVSQPPKPQDVVKPMPKSADNPIPKREVTPTPKPVATPTPKPKTEAAPKAAPTPKAEPPQDDNEKTRLTDVQQKAVLKTPIRKEKKEKSESPSALSGVFKALLYITLVLIVSVIVAYFIIQFANDVFAFVKPEEAVTVVIPKDATVGEVADILGESGVIKYPSLFRIYAKLMDEDGVDEDGNSVFIAGTYEVSPMNNYMQLLPYFMERERPREVVWVTFPEGSCIEEMITVLVDTYGIASREDFKRAINEYDYDMEFLDGIEELEGRYYRLEGYLFPDTYQFYTDSTAETVVYKMLQNFEDKLDYLSYGDKTYLDRLEELGMTLDEVVTLASMIEWEVKYPIDYDQVSSVFYNRLGDKANFPRFDSDATTVYAIMMETGERPETLGAEELAFDNPYNTRKHGGFPPGAISNPGYEALYSAFYPAKTKYYYFVAQSNGYNLYARTAPQHNANVAAVRKEAQN